MPRCGRIFEGNRSRRSHRSGCPAFNFTHDFQLKWFRHCERSSIRLRSANFLSQETKGRTVIRCSDVTLRRTRRRAAMRVFFTAFQKATSCQQLAFERNKKRNRAQNDLMFTFFATCTLSGDHFRKPRNRSGRAADT